MIKNKKAVSGVITTIILIAIALAVLGIAYGFITGALNKAGDDVSNRQDDLDAIIDGTDCVASLGGACIIGDPATGGATCLADETVGDTFSVDATGCEPTEICCIA